MKRRFLGALLALGLVVAGTLVLVAYVNGAEDRAVAGQRMVNVLVVAQPIKAGTPADQLGGKVKLSQVPAKVRPDGAIANLADLKGLTTNADLVPGEQVLRTRFATPDAVQAAGIDTSKLVKLGVELEPERALAGRVKPGDIVAVVGSTDDPKLTRVFLHQVPVVSVDGAVTQKPKEKAPTDKLLVTLALDEQQAGQLVWTLEHGSVWLAQEPGTADQSKIGPIDQKAVLGQ